MSFPTVSPEEDSMISAVIFLVASHWTVLFSLAAAYKYKEPFLFVIILSTLFASLFYHTSQYIINDYYWTEFLANVDYFYAHWSILIFSLYLFRKVSTLFCTAMVGSIPFLLFTTHGYPFLLIRFTVLVLLFLVIFFMIHEPHEGSWNPFHLAIVLVVASINTLVFLLQVYSPWIFHSLHHMIAFFLPGLIIYLKYTYYYTHKRGDREGRGAPTTLSPYSLKGESTYPNYLISVIPHKSAHPYKF